MNTDAMTSRLASLSEKELVRWLTIFDHMAGIEEHLTDLSGMPPPDGEVAAIGRLLSFELKRRTAAKR